MKNQFKVTIIRNYPGHLEDPKHIYRIIKIRGAVGIVGAGPSPVLYRVGDYITEKDITRLFDNRNNDITVTV